MSLRTARLRALPLVAMRSERGSTSVQMVILMPVLFSVMFLGLQAALFYHARTVAIAAAQQGARAAGAETGSRQRRHRGRHIVRHGRRRIRRLRERIGVRQPLGHPGHGDRPRRRIERHPRLVSDRAAERHRPSGTDHHRMSQQTRHANRERGSATIEAVIGVPAFLLFVLLIIAAGRIALARQAVEASAAEAARSASISRTQAPSQDRRGFRGGNQPAESRCALRLPAGRHRHQRLRRAGRHTGEGHRHRHLYRRPVRPFHPRFAGYAAPSPPPCPHRSTPTGSAD